MRAKSFGVRAALALVGVVLASAASAQPIDTPDCRSAARPICDSITRFNPVTQTNENVHVQCTCGERIIYDVDLQADIQCNGAVSPTVHNIGLVVCRPSLRIEGNGHKISLTNAASLNEYGSQGELKEIFGLLIEGESESNKLYSTRVEDLVITGFHRGIRVKNARGARLNDLNVSTNALFSTSYGIDMTSGTETTSIRSYGNGTWVNRSEFASDPLVTGLRQRGIHCLVRGNGDEGIHAGEGAERTKIYKCAVANNGSTTTIAGENIYLQQAEKTTIKSVCTWHANSVNGGRTQLKADGSYRTKVSDSVFQGVFLVQADDERSELRGRLYDRPGADIVSGRVRLRGADGDVGEGGGSPTGGRYRGLSVYGRNACIDLEREDSRPMPAGNSFKYGCLSHCGDYDVEAAGGPVPTPNGHLPNVFQHFNSLDYDFGAYIQCGEDCVSSSIAAACGSAPSWPAGCSPADNAPDAQRLACCDRYWD